MYKEYRLKIKPLSTYITPWQSDTFVGHLFWAIKFIEGDGYLEKLINDSKNLEPPFIFSDGFVEGYLPKPDYPILKRSELIELGEGYGKDSYTALKKVKKISDLSADEFNSYINGCDIKGFIKNSLDKLKNNKELIKSIRPKMLNNTHNSINRVTGTTTENSLFTNVEYFLGTNIEFYIRLRDDISLDKLKKYIEYVALDGFGKKASSGKGAFELVSLELSNNFPVIVNPNAFIVLSNYIPKIGDYEEALSVKTLTKYGKIGGNEEELPFKKPFICFEKGSLFSGESKTIKGKILENLHHDSKVIQFGIPYIVAVRIDG